jgi:hypothetical protein
MVRNSQGGGLQHHLLETARSQHGGLEEGSSYSSKIVWLGTRTLGVANMRRSIKASYSVLFINSS